MSSSFEEFLVQYGFVLEKGDRECDHNKCPQYLWYVHDCDCCSYRYYKENNQLATIQAKDFAWYKYSGCEECMEGALFELSDI